ncbi:AcrR family transcriptional regulator [Amycolatopsis bartoniae]|uniref:Transcriptional regulator n=1 Tax=Amycolatopsis bartoniae TaxID=941986 RepID=A0A8H9IV03_9PSEU|nr:TetR/AcrR family transcriptional regulator [Amycolatopsis bartoniae]MBB2934548.1 AcrR family transcriptional regulator [Amycolatopsis bartoniae]TVT06883.1 TetR/AcrR family transcriptional regulator [Amycolatopsis bartoniae]GHF46556.1 transcriptional regulator [Amycolatopsis bartoniae]
MSTSPPLTTKGQATRDRIVRAAADLMFRHGVAGTSTPAIRDAAGVSSSQIYHYFADKDALTRAVIEYQTEAIVGAQSALLSRLDSVAALRAWRDVVVNAVRDLDCVGGCPLGSLASELADQDPGARAALADSFSRWAGAIRDGLRHMVDARVLRPEADPDKLSLAMLAALQGGLLLAQAQRDPAALEAALDTMIERIEQQAAR